MKRYSLKMINSNGYEIKKESNDIEQLKNHAAFYPMRVFFAWIYDSLKDEMIMQSDYKKSFRKCNNETFIPYYI
jgi:hypothetical protein